MPTLLRRAGMLVLGLLAVSAALADPSSFLQLRQDIPLMGGTARFDYQALDPESGLLYISHMGAGQIVVFNTRQGKVITTLSGFPGVTGLLVVPGLNRLYASVTRQHEVAVLDTESLKTLARIPAGHFPDGMAYVPSTGQLYVSDELGGEETVIDTATNRRVASLKMGGEVGNTRYDPGSGLVLVLGQDRNELVAIDPRTRKIAHRYPVYGGRHPHGLCLDENARLAFIACDKDSKLLVMDLRTFQVTGVSDVGRGPDVMAFDAGLGYLYVASESGVVSVFRVRARQVEKVGDFAVGDNAHSVAVDPKTHLAYFPLRKDGKGPVLRIMKPSN